MKLKIRIEIDGKYIDELLDNGSLFFIDGTKVNRKKSNEVKIYCDSCNNVTLWKSVPTREYIIKSKFFCRSCRQLGEKNSQFGKKWNDERRLKRSDEMSGQKNPMYGRSFIDVWTEKFGLTQSNYLLNEHRLKSSKMGKSNGMFHKSFFNIWVDKYGLEKANQMMLDWKSKKSDWLKQNPEHHNKMIINSHIRKYRKTSIEKILELYLIEKKVNYKYNFILDGKYQFDFLIKDLNLIIETHGDYWHANPNYYSDDDPVKKPLNETQKYKINLEKLKSDYVVKNGYQIVCLWESDIKNENYKNILRKWNL